MLMRFRDLSRGAPLFFDPAHIVGVVPAIEAPKADIPPAQQIVNVIGSQLLIAGCAPFAVQGKPDEVAQNVATAKAKLRELTAYPPVAERADDPAPPADAPEPPAPPADDA